MKNFKLLGFTEKSDFYGGVRKKPIYRERLPENGGGRGGAFTVCRFNRGGGLANKRRGGVFEGGLIPQCTL